MSTTVLSKNFTLDAKSDIHMTFSAKLEATALVTVTAQTKIIDGSGITSANTYDPIKIFSTTETFTYSDFFEAISAGDTTIYIDMIVETGQCTINSGMATMNLIIFPASLTASDSANVTYILAEVASASRTLYMSNVTPLAFDNATGKIFASIKWIDGVDKWDVYISENSGDTWASLNMPEATGVSTAGGITESVASLCCDGTYVHVAHLMCTSTSTYQHFHLMYNAYNISADSWVYTSMKSITNSFTNQSDEGMTRIICTSTRQYYFTQKYSDFYRYNMCYSEDCFASQSNWFSIESYASAADFIFSSGGTSIHAVYNDISGGIHYMKYNVWDESDSAWGSAITLHSTSAASAKNYTKNIEIDSNGDIWAGAIYGGATETFYLFKMSAGSTAFTTAYTTNVDNLDDCAMLLDNNEDPILYVNTIISAYSTINSYRFDKNASAFETANISVIPLLSDDTISYNIFACNYNNRLYALYESATAANTYKIAFYSNVF